MRIKKVGILDENQLIGNNALKTLNDYGLQCFSSDLSRIMGNQYDGQGYGSYYISGTDTTNSKKDGIRYVRTDGKLSTIYSRGSQMGVRICASFDDIEDFDLDNIYDLNIEYPLTAISGMVGKTIDRLFNEKSKLIIKTGRSHDIDGTLYDEYEVFGIRFIKMENKTDAKMLSDGTSTERNKDVYLQVEKIPFMVDEDAKLIYSSSILFSTNFDNKVKDNTSELIKLLNGNFLRSINDELEHKEPCIFFDEPEEVRKNRYGFDFSELTEEEIVEICINSNIAVFLHGKTGTGKTETVRAACNYLNIPMIEFNAANLNTEGIVGTSIESLATALYENAGCNLEKAQRGLVFLDEFDKLSDAGDLSTKAPVKNILLTFTGGGSFPIDNNRYSFVFDSTMTNKIYFSKYLIWYSV